MNNGFIVGGDAIYGVALRREYCADMKRLKVELKACATAFAREDLRRQMLQLTATYQRKRQAIDRSLF